LPAFVNASARITLIAAAFRFQVDSLAGFRCRFPGAAGLRQVRAQAGVSLRRSRIVLSTSVLAVRRLPQVRLRFVAAAGHHQHRSQIPVGERRPACPPALLSIPRSTHRAVRSSVNMPRCLLTR
jgi:hypothetical protein